MPRPELHSTERLLDAARDLVLKGGARAATVEGLVVASGAPKGSIYHKFPTLDDLLAAMWLRTLKRSQVRPMIALKQRDVSAPEKAVAAALGVHDFAVEEPADARLLVSMRREDLLRGVTDPAIAEDLRTINDGFRRQVKRLARDLYGSATADAVQRTTFASVDLPYGAVRRHLGTGSPIPGSVRPQLEAAVRAVLTAS